MLIIELNIFNLHFSTNLLNNYFHKKEYNKSKKSTKL
nr:hypothetical protein RU987_pgp151 [Laurencia catarinensis]WMP12429.1 hypothetical protein [Laurencia catarinensis]